MLDEALLDAPEALTRADTDGLLRGAAESGARVRTALRRAEDAGIAALRPDGRPRSVLVAGSGPVASCVADLLGAFTNGVLPVTLIHPTGAGALPTALRWGLPGWAGPLDLLLIVTSAGDEPGLDALVEQAYRRGCTTVAVAPPGGPLAESIGEVRGMTIPLAPAPHETYSAPAPDSPASLASSASPVGVPGELWALLTPLLALADRLGLVAADSAALNALADRLDAVAERCGPAIATYSNPGKTLATELAGALPLLWSEGSVAGAVARHSATVLAALPGRPALAAGLPEALTAHRALLAGEFAAAAGGDDFFRDRVEEPEPLHARVVLLREHTPAGDSATVAARDLAYAHDIGLSELEAAEESSSLEAAAELIATLDFAAVYLTLTGTGTAAPSA